MDPLKNSASRLFSYSLLECKKDEVEEKYERCYQSLQALTAGQSEKEAHDALTRACLKDKGQEEITLGLIAVILGDPKNAVKAYRDLTLISRDGLVWGVGQLNTLVVERFPKFSDTARAQTLWFLREMIRTGVSNFDNLYYNILRHAAGGDTSEKNVLLTETLLDILQENRAWLDKNPILLSYTAYTYLRLIEDHGSPGLSALRQKEVNFVVVLLRERFTDCMGIGRDLLRLLQAIARIPEVELLWRDIHVNPTSLSPSFTGIHQLMQIRTPRRYLRMRLTPEMERKITFFTNYVRFGTQKRYQDWFLKQYLMTGESQSLRIDLIRFIVGVIHPTNEQLNSDLIPRWAVIGWLITSCTSTVAAANAKLALFYDWLFFDPERDNIMDIEPAILVMSNSMRSHPAVTATLLDFMCRIITNFSPPLTEHVRAGINTSLRQILKMRVLSSLAPLFDSPKLDRELKVKIRSTFKEFCSAPFSEVVDVAAIIREERESMETRLSNPLHPREVEAHFSDDDMPIVINDDEDDLPLSKVKPESKGDRRDMQLESNMEFVIQQLSGGRQDIEARCETMERLVQLILENDEMGPSEISNIAVALSQALSSQFEERVFPPAVNEETLEGSIRKPLFVLFRNISQLPEKDVRRQPLLSILNELRALQPKLGCLLLYFLIVCKLNDQKGSVYQSICYLRHKKLVQCLEEDLTLCQDSEVNMLVWMVPFLFEQYTSITRDNPAILHIIVSTVDSLQLQQLITSIILGQLTMVTSDNIVTLIKKSLTWETWEQTCLWQLVTAHGISLSAILPILPELDYDKHPEAITPIMLMLRQERPTADTMKQVLSRTANPAKDRTAVTILKHWACEHGDKFAELVGGLLSSRYPGTPNKRKRGHKLTLTTGVGFPSAEQVLGHLDQMRLACRMAETHIYSSEPIQRALQAAVTHGPESLRQSFGDLFALVEVEDKRHNSRSRVADKSRSSKPKASLKEISDSSENTSDEEEVVKPKQPKKRKKLIGSDSD